MIIDKLIRNASFVACICGLITTFSFAPFFVISSIVGLSFLLNRIKTEKSVKNILKTSFAFGFGHFTGSLYWIAVSISWYLDQFWWAIPLVLFGFPAVLSLFICFVSFFSAPFKNRKDFPIIFSGIWALFEWIRSWIFTGFPWNLLGNIVSCSIYLIQTASLCGVFGLSIIVCFIASGFFKGNVLKHSAISFSIVIVMLIFGHNRLKTNPTKFSEYQVRIVQPCIAQDLKYKEEDFAQNFQKYIALSKTKVAVEPDFIVWPETAITALLEVPMVSNLARTSIAEFKNAILITGGLTRRNNDFYNSMYGMDKTGKILFIYSKVHLVPFGEFTPFKELLEKFGFKNLDLGTGDAGQVFEISKLKIRPLICYEIIFPSEVRNQSDYSDVIINITNDVWFRNSSGPYQHFYMAQMRAVENGVAVVRSANNGISGFIDPLGRIISRTRIDEINIVDSLLPAKLSTKTLYSSIGDLGAIIIMICIKFLQMFWELMHKFLKKVILTFGN